MKIEWADARRSRFVSIIPYKIIPGEVKKQKREQIKDHFFLPVRQGHIYMTELLRGQ